MNTTYFSNIQKVIWLSLIMMTLVFSYGMSVQASTFKPYSYTFEESTNEFNGIKGVKNLVITFDKEITATKADIIDDIFVVQQTIEDEATFDEANQLKIVDLDDVEIDGKDGKVLTIPFKNLEYIDYANPDAMDYVLVIKKDAQLHYDQLEDYIYPFKIYDILPGFKSVVLESGSGVLNKDIFPTNPARDIYVHVPKLYIEKIETLHRIDGVVYKGDKQEAGGSVPSLTNIDVLADKDVARLKVTFDEELLSRDLERHSKVKGFTMTQADIEEAEGEDAEDFTLTAYDQYGRLLVEDNKKFYIEITEKDKEQPHVPIKVNNYITKIPKEFGKTFTLYELMNNSKTFENILNTLTVDDLNNLGITYANQFSTVEVKNLEQFEMALANEKIKNINLGADIEDDVSISRDVTINGDGFEIDGDIYIGDGNDITVRIYDLKVTGDKTVNVGANGTLILDNVEIDNTLYIESAGSNSIHLNNVEVKNNVVFNNTTPVRIVNEGSNPLNVTLNSDKEVILEGSYGTVKVTENTILTIKSKIKIQSIEIDNGKKPTIKIPSNWDQLNIPIIGDSEIIDSEEEDSDENDRDENDSENNIEWEHEKLQGNLGLWKSGLLVKFNVYDENISIPNEKWVLYEHNLDNLLEGVSIELENQLLKLKGLPADITENYEGTVKFKAEHDGKSYFITIPVVIEKDSDNNG